MKQPTSMKIENVNNKTNAVAAANAAATETKKSEAKQVQEVKQQQQQQKENVGAAEQQAPHVGGGGNRDNLSNDGFFVPDVDREQADETRRETIETIDDFDEMQLRDELLRGVYGNGFEKPSPVQARTVVPLATGRDVVAQAQSGTGKTGAFAIGTLARVDFSVRAPQVLVLEPVRELARQTATVYGDIGRHLDARVVCVTGGTSLNANRQALRSSQIVVGTPGRLIDCARRGWLRLNEIRCVVLDEADEMLSLGFQDDIRHIMQQVGVNCQVGVFSATFDNESEELTRHFTRDALRVRVRNDALTLAGIRQFYVAVDDVDKMGTLIDIYNDISVGQSMIFAATRRRVEEICAQLEEADFTPCKISGDLTHDERQEALARFDRGHARVLVTTDVCARGIDVQGVSCVVNYDLPRGEGAMATYIHRIGRAGRYGRTGIAINFVSQRDAGQLRAIERFYDTEIAEMPADFAASIA